MFQLLFFLVVHFFVPPNFKTKKVINSNAIIPNNINAFFVNFRGFRAIITPPFTYYIISPAYFSLQVNLFSLAFFVNFSKETVPSPFKSINPTSLSFFKSPFSISIINS